jgi:hypothetical protein
MWKLVRLKITIVAEVVVCWVGLVSAVSFSELGNLGHFMIRTS